MATTTIPSTLRNFLSAVASDGNDPNMQRLARQVLTLDPTDQKPAERLNTVFQNVTAICAALPLGPVADDVMKARVQHSREMLVLAGVGLPPQVTAEQAGTAAAPTPDPAAWVKARIEEFHNYYLVEVGNLERSVEHPMPWRRSYGWRWLAVFQARRHLRHAIDEARNPPPPRRSEITYFTAKDVGR